MTAQLFLKMTGQLYAESKRAPQNSSNDSAFRPANQAYHSAGGEYGGTSLQKSTRRSQIPNRYTGSPMCRSRIGNGHIDSEPVPYGLTGRELIDYRPLGKDDPFDTDSGHIRNGRIDNHLSQNSSGFDNFAEDVFNDTANGRVGFGKNAFGENAFGENSFGKNSFEMSNFKLISFGQKSFDKTSWNITGNGRIGNGGAGNDRLNSGHIHNGCINKPINQNSIAYDDFAENIFGDTGTSGICNKGFGNTGTCNNGFDSSHIFNGCIDKPMNQNGFSYDNFAENVFSDTSNARIENSRISNAGTGNNSIDHGPTHNGPIDNHLIEDSFSNIFDTPNTWAPLHPLEHDTPQTQPKKQLQVTGTGGTIAASGTPYIPLITYTPNTATEPPVIPEQWLPPMTDRFWAPYANMLRINACDVGFCNLAAQSSYPRSAPAPPQSVKRVLVPPPVEARALMQW
jgi:hypothetical protein